MEDYIHESEIALVYPQYYQILTTTIGPNRQAPA